jgi:hypothetical protein
MRPKLTRYLIEKGHATEEQCTEALQRQVVFGGKIGTNLLELFHITEDQLLEALSHTHRIPVADSKRLEQIDRSLIESFPEELARTHEMIPFEESQSRIHVAVTDAGNMDGLDALSFRAGKVAVPFITTELKMGFLLEKYYGVKRDRRFISVPEEERRLREERIKEQQKKMAEKTREVEAASEQTPETSVAVAEPPTSPPDAVTDATPPLDLTSFDGTSLSLAQAENRDDIAGTLLAFAGFQLERTILFTIKGKTVHGWRGSGMWKNPDVIKKIRFSLPDPSLIRDVAYRKEAYRGPLDDIVVHRQLIQVLGAPFPKEVVAFPLAIRNKVFCVLYGDNAVSNDPIAASEPLRRIALKAALSFEILILKAKIAFCA